MRARAAFVLLVAAAALAGCLAATGPAPVTQTSGPAAAGVPTPGANGTPSASVPGAPALPTPFSVAGPSNHRTIVRNGSFTWYQSCLPVGCFTGDYEEGLDLSPHIPVGVPARVNVTLTYEQDVATYVGLDLAVDGAEVYNLDITDAQGRKVWLDAVVARRDPQDTVVAQAQGFYPDDGSSGYTMRARVGAHSDVVTPQVPTQVNVPAEAGGFTLGYDGAEGSFRATVWDPVDKLVGHYRVSSRPGSPDNVTVRLGPDHPPGRYVVLVQDLSLSPGHAHGGSSTHHHHGVVARPLNATAQPRMTTLGLTYQRGGSYHVSSGETVRWEPHFAQAPIQVGILAQPTGGVSVNPGTLSGSMRSPAGEVLSFRGEGFLLGFGGYGWVSPAGDPALEGGAYHATFRNDGGSSVEVAHLVGFYQR